MNWMERYQKKIVTLDEAADKIKSGDRVVAGHACGSPEPILEAIVDRADRLRDVEIVHMVSMGRGRYCQADFSDAFRHNSLFAGKTSRDAIHSGRGDYTPCFFSEIPGLFKNNILPVDVALVTVSEPDRLGNFSLGISVDYTLDAAKSARLVIAEVTPNMPRINGNSFLNIDDIDCLVPSERQLIELPPPAIGDTEKAIGAHVAKLIQDGDCLQLGIGAIPDAVLTFLGEKKDLGIHSEMISDGVIELVDKGVINGKRKCLHPSKIIITFAMGSDRFYRWLDNNSMVEMHPVDYVNDPFVIAQNENMVSINSAISVDLMGQVSADAMGAFQFSGVGGQVDFVRGVRRSKNGRSIITLPATAKGGTVSRIAVTLQNGQAVTTSRNDVDHIVTEFGVASLRGKTLRERAKSLIAIAAPQFREDLEKAYREVYLK